MDYYSLHTKERIGQMLKKIYPYRYILLFSLLSLLVMGFIFQNSLQNSAASNNLSDKVAAEIKPIVDPDAHITVSRFQFFVRKLAHGVEFCVLGASLCALMYSIQSAERKKCRVFMTLFLALATAVTDEYIQSFTGRTSSVDDIIIDFSGAVCGMILLSLFVIFAEKLRCRVRLRKARSKETVKNSSEPL